MTLERLLLAAAAVFAVVSPYLGIPGWTPSLATVAFFTAVSLIGLNLIFGYCGMLALGQAAFSALSGYGAGILLRYWRAELDRGFRRLCCLRSVPRASSPKFSSGCPAFISRSARSVSPTSWKGSRGHFPRSPVARPGSSLRRRLL